ncbi:MAG: SCO1664 family protein [Chloroflexota bacterium]
MMAKRIFKIGDDESARWVSPGEAAALLAAGSVQDCQSIPWSSNYTFVARICAQDQPDVYGVYKPRRGEAPLYDFPDGTLYRRERAAYVVCEALGFGLVPPTIIRDGPYGVGSVQLLIDVDPEADFFKFKHLHTTELQAIALFDVLTNNADRKAGHCLKARDGRLWCIDHGLTFNTAPKLRTVIWDFAGEPVPARLLARLREFSRNATRTSALAEQLHALLDRREVSRFFGRIEAVLEHRVYPEMTSRRSVPWPWY